MDSKQDSQSLSNGRGPESEQRIDEAGNESQVGTSGTRTSNEDHTDDAARGGSMAFEMASIFSSISPDDAEQMVSNVGVQFCTCVIHGDYTDGLSMTMAVQRQYIPGDTTIEEDETSIVQPGRTTTDSDEIYVTSPGHRADSSHDNGIDLAHTITPHCVPALDL